MEQRNGRIDRHGQREKEVLIWHPVDGGDESHASVGGHGDDILRALRKLESMRADMGSVNPVIAPQMSGLIEGSLKDLDTRLAEAKIAKARRFVRAERELKERVAKLHERLLATQQDFHLTPDHIQMAVKTGLALAGRPRWNPSPSQMRPKAAHSGCHPSRDHGRAVWRACVTRIPSRYAPSPSTTPWPRARRCRLGPSESSIGADVPAAVARRGLGAG